MWLGIVRVVLTLALSIVMVPLPIEAQAVGKVRRIGFLTFGPAPPAEAPSPFEHSAETAPFVQGLRELGWAAGHNLTIAPRFAEGQLDRLPALAAELVRMPVELIVTVSFPAALAAKQATATIPIVFLGAGDPVATGLVASLARPGGNLTGVAALETELSTKRLELLKMAMPQATQIAVLWNRADVGMSLRFQATQAAARALGLQLQPISVQEPSDFEGAFAAMRQERPDALFVVADPLTLLNRHRLLAFAAERRLPTMYEFRWYVEEGGLLSYGPTYADLSRRAAVQADRILRGTKPSDLPVEQAMKFDLVINLKTAQAFGLTIPPTVLFQATEVLR